MHIHELKLLTCKQFGFISGRSTVTQLLTYLDKCVKTIAEGGVIDTIYLDFAKAFDTVPHQRLTGKTSSVWYQRQHLQLDRKLPKWEETNCYCQWRKIQIRSSYKWDSARYSFGAMLFVIYINDLLDDIRSDGLLFADDTKLFRKIVSREDAVILQSDIRLLESWSQKWLSNLHPDKCHVLILGRFENIMYTPHLLHSLCYRRFSLPLNAHALIM